MPGPICNEKCKVSFAKRNVRYHLQWEISGPICNNKCQVPFAMRNVMSHTPWYASTITSSCNDFLFKVIVVIVLKCMGCYCYYYMLYLQMHFVVWSIHSHILCPILQGDTPLPDHSRWAQDILRQPTVSLALGQLLLKLIFCLKYSYSSSVSSSSPLLLLIIIIIIFIIIIMMVMILHFRSFKYLGHAPLLFRFADLSKLIWKRVKEFKSNWMFLKYFQYFKWNNIQILYKNNKK